MRSYCQTPLLARLPALVAALVLSLSAAMSSAQSNAPSGTQALPEIQRLMKQGQMPQALEKAERYISAMPKDPQGRFLKGLILTEQGRQADAIAIFTKLTEDFPELPEPYNNLAVLYAQQKQYDKARTALEMAIRTHPSYSVAHENLGDVYAKLASQAYGKALQIDASNTATQSKLAMIKEIISTPGKPASKRASTTPAEPETAKAATAVPAKQIPTSAKTPEATASASGPVAHRAESKATPAEKEKAAGANYESEIGKTLQGWASAWSNKEVKTYLAYYASDFQTPKGMTRKAWENERSQRIDKPGKIMVGVDNLQIKIDGNKASVKFRQNYTSATLKTSATKTMVLVKTGNKWLIQQERVG